MGNKEAAQYVKDVLAKAMGYALSREVGVDSDEFYSLFRGKIGSLLCNYSQPPHEERRSFVSKVEQYLEDNHKYVSVECDGGGEGEGEYCYGIIRLDDKFFKAEWNYYSYNGCEYDDIEETIKEVKAVQKFITVYE